MAVLGKVAGTMLKDNLIRNGVDLIIDGNLMYYDVSNRRIGINTITPGNALTVNGSVTASNVYINDTSITALNNNLILNSLSGNINASTLRIFNVVDPINNQDAATKNYVDNRVISVSSPNLYIANSNTGNTNIVLNSETLYLIGNTNQIDIVITENSAAFSLASDLVISNLKTTNGGQVQGYLSGAIGANIANSGAFTTVTATGNISGDNIIVSSVSGQVIGYHTGAIGANLANTGVFTTLTATSGYQGAVSGPLNGTLGATTPNSVVATSITTTSGGQLIGYLTGAIGANTANTGAFTSITASSTANITGNINGFSYINSTNGFNWANGSPYSGYMTVSEINTANVLSNLLTNINTLRFDRDTGLYVDDWGNGTARISLGSSFATWIVSGQGNLRAQGEDKVEFKAGAGMLITTDNTSIPQSITFTSSGNLASANIGNLYLHNNTIDVVNTDGNINLNPNGDGIVSINSTKAILLPIGNNLARPANPAIGMLRYNTVINSVEVWDGADWLALSTNSTTTIISDTFTGNGVLKNFTLSQASTTGGTLVTINGVIQIPDVSYSVTGTTLTFGEAPLATDVIEARLLITTASTTSMVVGNSYINFGNASDSYPVTVTIGDNVTALFGTANTTVYGNLVVRGNISGNIAPGSNTSTTSAGYLGMPQTIVSAANYTVAITDQGKHLYVTTAANVTIPANSSVSFPVGSTIAIIANAGASANISVTSDTMYLGGTGTTGYRTLAAYGMATAVKTTGNVWFISGSGLT
jgi:hypothetical protein